MSQMTPSPICLALFTALRQEAPPKRPLRHFRCRLPFGKECLQFKPVNQSTGSMILPLTCSITIPLSPGSLTRHWTLKMLIAGLGFFCSRPDCWFRHPLGRKMDSMQKPQQGHELPHSQTSRSRTPKRQSIPHAGHKGEVKPSGGSDSDSDDCHSFFHYPSLLRIFCLTTLPWHGPSTWESESHHPLLAMCGWNERQTQRFEIQWLWLELALLQSW